MTGWSMTTTNYYVRIALDVAGRSGCQKSRRGVVIWHPTDHSQPHYTGTNAPALGSCDNTPRCREVCPRICVHAEQAALLKVPRDLSGLELLHVKSVDGALVPSGPPSCLECSKLLLASGQIDGVWLYHKQGLDDLCRYHEQGWHRYPVREFHELTLQFHER